MGSKGTVVSQGEKVNPYGADASVSLATMKKGLSKDSAPSRSLFLSQNRAQRELMSVPTQSLSASPVHLCAMHQAIDVYWHFKDVFFFASPLALFLLPECPVPGSCPFLAFWGSLLPLGHVGFCFLQFNSKYSLRALAQFYEIKNLRNPACVKT